MQVMILEFGESSQSSYNDYFNGYISNIRITKSCRYFGDFSIPSSESDPGELLINETSLLMHFDGNQKDPLQGANDLLGHTITAIITGNPLLQSITPFGISTSCYFDGSSRIQTSFDSRVDVSTGDFTIECWCNPISLSPEYQQIFEQRSSYNRTGIACYFNYSNIIFLCR